MQRNQFVFLTLLSFLVCFTCSLANGQCIDTINVSGVTSICKGRSTTITLNHPASTYTWQPGNLTGVQQVLSPTTTTAYTIKSDDGAGCTDSIQLLITVNPVPAVTTAFAGTSCLGHPIMANFTDSVAALFWKGTVVTDTQKIVLAAWGGSPTVAAGGNGAGATADKLNDPNGIFVDALNNVYIADQANHRVQKWAPGALAATTVAGGNGQGSADNQLDNPKGVFVDIDGNIFVADFGNNRIQKWAPGASAGITVAGGNGLGNGANQLGGPADVFVNGSGSLLIVEMANNRVSKWRQGGDAGLTVAGGNGSGVGANQLASPSSLFVDISGAVYVSDGGNNRVQKWLPGAVTGSTVAGNSAGTSGAGGAYLANPKGIWVDGLGNVFIADQGNSLIQVWAKGSVSGTTVASSSITSCAGVALDAQGKIFVSDGGSNNVITFSHVALENSFTPQFAKKSYRALAYAFNGCFSATGYVQALDTTAPKAPTNLKGYGTNLCDTSAYYSVRVDKTLTYTWAVPSGAQILSGQGSFVVKIHYPNNFTNGIISVTAASSCAVSRAASIAVNSAPPMPAGMIGLRTVKANQTNIRYYIFPKPSAADAAGVVYTWSFPTGTSIKSGQGTNSVFANWGSTAGNINLFAKNACASSPVLQVPVTITTPAALMGANGVSALITDVDKGLSLYPNPVTETAWVTFTAKAAEKYTVSVVDMNGQHIAIKYVEASVGTNRVGLYVGNLAPGVYFVNLGTKGKLTNTLRMLKN